MRYTFSATPPPRVVRIGRLTSRRFGTDPLFRRSLSSGRRAICVRASCPDVARAPLIHPNKEADIQARARIRFSHLYFLKRRSPKAKKAQARSARSPETSETKRTPRSKPTATASSSPTPDVERLVVRSTDDGWSLIVDELDTPAWTVSTKKKAVSAATDAAKALAAKLVIETASGKVQKTHDYQASA
jgi:hypothetical protein